MNIQFNTREPVYAQVIRYFKEQIATGKLVAGQEIPSRRELGATLKINPNTAQRAYKEMEDQLLIHTERNKPSRITYDQDVLDSVRDELIQESIDTFLQAIRTIQVPLDEVIAMIQASYKEGETEHD
ncbi:GntR family transcriptional regulator [Shouchella clausii]|jgi:GntR family transcriptional regulator|uniref:GntR family transcriptional regulator n=3 Tax=Shouchella TaxID=2893057 RepID=Q5WD94_SHOC1|nr:MULTISPECIES: GntR family transcriptional regulator [Shouchella]MCM3313134.1 GntR family transcriptional regulator [Psychrobacillus sp. MER TA 17]ALA53988.1 Transcriptional regulator, GntR family [Shouchella clausii]KKI87314.1 GntR family transcriptional regulator [Shouchella clausii]MBU3229456.1 GntR family transcriptional regulator [Shouchella clausii]MBU3265321.1 GntR family transcriptional regulator [Shouchella clausii]